MNDSTGTYTVPADPKASTGTKTPNRIRTILPVLQERAANLGMVWVLVVLMIIATILNPRFLTTGNLINVLSQNAPVGIIAVGMTFVLIAGGFDLSVAAVLALGGVTYATLSHMMPAAPAILITLAMGAALGLVNAFLITKAKVNAFIATLATASLFSGVTLLLTNAIPVNMARKGYDFLAADDFLGVPLSVWLLASLIAAGWFLLSKTVYGRGIYAIGGNNEAARLAGLPVIALRASTYVLTAMLAALAGIVLASVIGVGQPGVAPNVTLNAIAIVIIGGTSMLGGEGAVWRTLVGLLIFGTINNVFDILAFPQAMQDVALGVILLGAVSLDAYTRSRRRSGEA
ncbi:ABC transporter permease [Pseudarthrobacter sp. fls2-241-R2A-168]|uniref:ABC transporter permease n=1 Tax=Pseudarthrobacter sp. fls2-241-R2A-168 TaxID=3040304 RepID=UPI002554298E|nr:ABC transporter permease [Pseudarthrobacter sp. fls2-241-R2A-168]